MVLTAPLKQLSTTLSCLLILFTGCSVSGSESQLPVVTQTPGYDSAGSLDVDVRRPTGAVLVGMGVELDPHFLSQNVTRGEGATAADWDQVFAPRIRAMQIQRFRVMLLPQWWEPRNDNDDPSVVNQRQFTFDSREMQSLYQVLDLAQEQQIDVTLVLWGCPTWCDLLNPEYSDVKRHFLCTPDGTNWVTEPSDAEEFAESFSTVVKYLIDVKGYTCIKELTPFNEPDGGITVLDRYIPLVKTLDKRLRADNIRQKVKLNLSDNTDTRRFFLEGCAAGLAQEADLFNSHTYIFGYQTPNKTIYDWERENVAVAKRAKKDHFVGEFGSDQCVGSTRQTDIDRYDRGVLMTRIVVNFLNAGAVGASYWSLLDQYYDRKANYMGMQQLGLWRYLRKSYAQDPDPTIFPSLDTDYQVRPQYFAYSLLTRFIRKGAEVYPLVLDDEFVAGTALHNSDGTWTYVIANGSSKDKSINLRNTLSADNTPGKVYRYERNLLPDEEQQIAPTLQITGTKQTFQLCIRSQSVLVVTTQQ
ncbi:MAG: hypothetical protein RR270_02560 [Alistipes sp.]